MGRSLALQSGALPLAGIVVGNLLCRGRSLAARRARGGAAASWRWLMDEVTGVVVARLDMPEAPVLGALLLAGIVA